MLNIYLKLKENFSHKIINKYVILTQGVAAAFGLITGKIIALYIEPSAFGLYNIQFAIYALLFSLIFNPLLQFFKSTSKSLVKKIGYQYYLYSAICFLLIFFCFIFIIFSLKFGIDLWLILLLTISVIANVFFNSMVDYFNVFNKLIVFSSINLIRSLVGFLLLVSLFFLNYKYKDGSKLLWLLQILGYLISISFFIKYFNIKYKTSYNISYKKFIKKYFLYAWPLIALSIWSWLISYSDRLIIEYYQSVHEVGIYNASYSVGSKFFLLLNPIFLTFLVPKIYSNISRVKKVSIVKKFINYYAIISVPVLIITYLTSDFIGSILLSKEYESGFHIIFFTSCSYFLLTTVFIYETIFYSEEKTKIIFYSNLIVAIVNVVLNLLIVPLYGITGAAFSTLVSFLIQFIIVRTYIYKF